MNIKMRTLLPLLHTFPPLTRPIQFHGISELRAQRECVGKFEPRSIIVITVVTHICISLYCLPSALPYINSTAAALGRKLERSP